jgi:hypothetical protein
VPPGCEASLSGIYVHQLNDAYRYEVADQGNEVLMHAFQQYGDTRRDLGAGSDIIFHRTSTGFHGEAHGTARLEPSKKLCPVTFPYEITACAPDRITMRTLQSFHVNDDCSVRDPNHLDLIEQVLLRVSSPASTSATSIDGGANPTSAIADGGVDAGSVASAPVDAGTKSSPGIVDAGASVKVVPPSPTPTPIADAGAPTLPDAGHPERMEVDGG